jgi:hypothetical protein
VHQPAARHVPAEVLPDRLVTEAYPESIATEHGHALLANFLEICGIEAKAQERAGA